MPITEETDTPGWSGRPSLLIADDDPVIRSTLSSQLAPDFDVVAMADDAGQAVELAAEHRDALPPPALQDDSHPGICVERHLDRVVGRAPINHDDFGDTSGQTLDERRDVARFVEGRDDYADGWLGGAASRCGRPEADLSRMRDPR